MFKKIALENGLTNVAQALQAAGFDTTSLEGQAFYNVQAIVVKSQGTDILAPDSGLRIPVINAAGRSAEEVVDVLRNRLF